jgi:hypothetical protein
MGGISDRLSDQRPGDAGRYAIRLQATGVSLSPDKVRVTHDLGVRSTTIIWAVLSWEPFTPQHWHSLEAV